MQLAAPRLASPDLWSIHWIPASSRMALGSKMAASFTLVARQQVDGILRIPVKYG